MGKLIAGVVLMIGGAIVSEIMVYPISFIGTIVILAGAALFGAAIMKEKGGKKDEERR